MQRKVQDILKCNIDIIMYINVSICTLNSDIFRGFLGFQNAALEISMCGLAAVMPDYLS